MKIPYSQKFFGLFASVLTFSLLFCSWTYAQKIDIQRVEPLHWWVGMKNPDLQILVYGKDISQARVSLAYPNVELREVITVENPNYLFLYVHIKPNAQAGMLPIKFKVGKIETTRNFELKQRVKAGEEYKSFTQADVMYLLMPDRFANGDKTNDQIAGMNQGYDRKDNYGRHGGDIKGIMNNLDYIKDMGFTSVWINPLLENDEPKESYHGYAITDFYRIDRRFGTNEDYKKLVEMCHQKGLKVIKDVVLNHCGDKHWFILDLPMKNWIHQFAEYTRSNFRLATLVDPNASQADRDLMVRGWFDKHMPDLDGRNQYLGDYLIQNNIWWIEYAQLDGLRLDTQPYPHKDYVAKWAKAILAEYPNFNIVGEVWEDKPSVVSYFQKGKKNHDGYDSQMPSVTDFPLAFAISGAINDNDGWDSGSSKLYYTLAQDAQYPNPSNNVIFADNHDISRIATNFNKDVKKSKMATALLFTLRGIPQYFYGAEINMEGPGNDHGKLRSDMPGGWEGDEINAFTQKGLTAEQTDLQNYTKRVLNWRKNSNPIHNGAFAQFLPNDNLYVYFRYTDRESVMVIMNNNPSEEKKLDANRYAERLAGFKSAVSVTTDETFADLKNIKVPAKTVLILDLKR
ncbi:MAG: alpha-amlyase [Bacteroidetes bacterium]|nr:MAG: alpha-amlyase [Bacteroidota bacterium]